MPLKDLSIRTAKSQEKPYKLADEKGLFLWVKPNGAIIELNIRKNCLIFADTYRAEKISNKNLTVLGKPE